MHVLQCVWKRGHTGMCECVLAYVHIQSACMRVCNIYIYIYIPEVGVH